MPTAEECKSFIENISKQLAAFLATDGKGEQAEKSPSKEEVVKKTPLRKKKAEGETPEVKAEKPEKAKAKNITRMTAAYSASLEEAIKGVDVEWDKSLSKEFMAWANSLSEEDYKNASLKEHMAKFATTKMPPLTGGGGGALPEPKTLTVDELKKNKTNLVQVSPGVFQDKTTGGFVTGPAEDEEEDLVEKKHDGEVYLVGEKTKRVYKPQDDGPDEFVGYWGVGDW